MTMSAVSWHGRRFHSPLIDHGLERERRERRDVGPPQVRRLVAAEFRDDLRVP
jgi:hypothetical protein